MTHKSAISLILAIEASEKRLYDEEVELINVLKGFSRKPSLKQGLWLQKIYCRVYGGSVFQQKEIIKI